MTKFITAYSSNLAVDCYIVKGRLETEGIRCYIYDENILWVDPFKAVAIRGVKLKVPFDKYIQSQTIISHIARGKLADEGGEYQISEIFNNEIQRQNEILSIKHKIRNDVSLLDKQLPFANDFAGQIDIEKIMIEEREFQKFAGKEFKFSWKQFLNELFNFERSSLNIFRSKPVEYYLEKELVDNYIQQKEPEHITHCPKCNSDNTSFGYAFDITWDILYLILSFIFMMPFFPIRKKYHCFECGHDFKNISTVTSN